MVAVLILTPWFPDMPGGREGNFIYDSAVALARAGVNVHVLVTRPILRKKIRDQDSKKTDRIYFPEFSSIKFVNYLQIPRGYFPSVSRYSLFTRAGAAIDALMENAEIDVIHAHTEGSAALAVHCGSKYGCPVVVTLHGINTAARFFSVRKEEFSDALRAAGKVILVGEPLRSFFSSLIGADKNFSIVPNGVDADRLPPPHHLFSSNVMRFISISNLVEGKGVDISLRALALLNAQGLSEWQYTIVGDGGEMENLMRLAKELDVADKVVFLGARPHGEVASLLKQADIFILPSYREAFGVAYLEAMASGLAVIGVQEQGPAAFIEHGKTGFLVEPKSVESLAECIKFICDNREYAADVANAGRQHVRANFTWEIHARKLMKIYEEQAGKSV